MGASPSVESVLKSAHNTLNNANKFQNNVIGDKPNTKPASTVSDYTHVREARKSPSEFMGIRSDQGSELKSAVESRESARKALEPNQ